MKYLNDVQLAKEHLEKSLQDLRDDPLSGIDEIKGMEKHVDILTKLCSIDEKSFQENGKYFSEKDMKKMWLDVYKRSIQDDKWVPRFIEQIVQSQAMPKYVRSNVTAKREMISQAQKSAQSLMDLFKFSSCDEAVIPYHQGIGDGLGALDDSFCDLPSDQQPKLSIVDVIKIGMDSFIDEVRYSGKSEREDEFVEARVFVSRMVRSNERKYGESMYHTVSVVTWCLFNKFYDDAGIAKIVKRSGRCHLSKVG